MSFTIRAAKREDLEALPEIELVAARLLLEYVPDLDLEYVTPAHEFREAMDDGLLWVAETDNRLVGFGLVELLDDGQPHFEELDVLPEFQRRGIGTELVRTICRWFEASPHSEFTLATFRHVPWNAPFYGRMGFEELDPMNYSLEIQRLVERESRYGLRPEQRVIMQYKP